MALPTKFKLTIEMENEAMQELSDVAEALREVAKDLENRIASTTIRDRNGNTVGFYDIKHSS